MTDSCETVQLRSRTPPPLGEVLSPLRDTSIVGTFPAPPTHVHRAPRRQPETPLARDAASPGERNFGVEGRP